MIQSVEEDRHHSQHLENSVDANGREEGCGQVQVGQHMSPME